MKLVDAHHHFWDLTRNYHPWLCDEPQIPFRYGNYQAIRNNYLPQDYARDASGFDIAASVYVEAEWNPEDPVGEVRWVEKIGATCSHPVLIVAQARLNQENIDQILAQHATFGRVRGVRHKPRATAFDERLKRGLAGSMDDPAWRSGFAQLERFGFSFDLQVPFWHLDQATELATDFPGTQIILNHTGLPSDRSPQGLAAWRQALEQLASQPNVAIKISGLGRAGLPWVAADNRQVILNAVDIFGVERCMFASNFPVDRLCGSFQTIYLGFQSIASTYSRNDREKLFYGNAARFYRLHDPTQSPSTHSQST